MKTKKKKKITRPPKEGKRGGEKFFYLQDVLKTKVGKGKEGRDEEDRESNKKNFKKLLRLDGCRNTPNFFFFFFKWRVNLFLLKI